MNVNADTRACLLYCRPGLENDCAAEVSDRANDLDIPGWCRTGNGYVEFHPSTPDGLTELARAVRFTTLVFPRQWCGVIARCDDLTPSDRASPLAAAVAGVCSHIGALRVEHADSMEARPLARLARKLHGPIANALARRGVVQDAGGPTLHVFLLTGDQALLGLSDPANASPWIGGIPRLRAPAGAPSRSTLKLEEALALFLNERERTAWLRPGRRAVDLGAAPGGWSWFMAQRGLQVDAVDNACLAATLEASPRVHHHRTDGFTFWPRQRVDWLLCDMVERPHRIAQLSADWLKTGYCRHAVVNLKLPMKKRWQAVRDHLEVLREALPLCGRLAARQLYHDREEITVFATTASLPRD